VTPQRGRFEIAAAALAGVAVAFALPPAGVWPLAAALAVPFALSARAVTARAAFGIGAAFAVGFFALYILWLPRSFAAPTLLGPWFWAFHPLLLAILAAMWGATTGVARRLGGRGIGTLLVLAPAWVWVEHLRASGYFAFPWGTLGYVWLETPVAQWASIVGVHGLSLLTTTVAALGAAAAVGGSWRAAGWGAALVIAAFAFAPSAGEGGLAPHRALLVQGNVDPFGRAATGRTDLDVHLDLTAAAAAEHDLIVWPEGAAMGFELEGARGAGTRSAIEAAAPGAAFVVGGRARVGRGATNSAFSLADAQVIGRYDKHVLVPFGERWPLVETLPGLYEAAFRLLGLPLLASTLPGPGPQVLASPFAPLGVAICYESVFPRVTAAMARGGAEVLLVITNDAWFARGTGARQHLDMGRMRAIETRRWLLRAGNDGITAVIDPSGRVIDALPRGVAGTLTAAFGTGSEVTPFVRFGDASAWVTFLLALAAAGVAGWRRRSGRLPTWSEGDMLAER
jgi:apolipoprotein N-acyltransferase